MKELLKWFLERIIEVMRKVAEYWTRNARYWEEMYQQERNRKLLGISNYNSLRKEYDQKLRHYRKLNIKFQKLKKENRELKNNLAAAEKSVASYNKIASDYFLDLKTKKTSQISSSPIKNNIQHSDRQIETIFKYINKDAIKEMVQQTSDRLASEAARSGQQLQDYLRDTNDEKPK